MSALHDQLDRAGVRTLAEVRRVQVAGPGDGRQEADRLVDGGADLVVLDALPSPAATAAVAVLLDLEPVAAIGTAATGDWAARVVTLRDTLGRVRRYAHEPDQLRAALDDPILSRTAELLEGLSIRQTPVLLGDSQTVAAAALLVVRRCPGAASGWLASGTPDDPAGRAALEELALTPLLDLGLHGDASRYALALLREAVGGA